MNAGDGWRSAIFRHDCRPQDQMLVLAIRGTNFMLKTFMAAAGIVGALALFPQAAEAKVNVFVGGYGGYGFAECQGRLGWRHCYGGYPGYGRYPGYGYYAPPPPPRFYDGYDGYDDGYDVGRLSCREARRILRSRGYRDIVARDCRGGTYSFFATRRGQPYRITVSASRGRIISITRI
jgi:hypothetical protein